MPKGIEVRIYATASGVEPYTEWERGLGDRVARARIRARIGRLRLGHLGDAKRVGEVFSFSTVVDPVAGSGVDQMCS